MMSQFSLMMVDGIGSDGHVVGLDVCIIFVMDSDDTMVNAERRAVVDPVGLYLGEFRRSSRIFSILEMKKSAKLFASCMLSSISGSLFDLILPIRPIVIENNFLEFPPAALIES